MAAPVQPMIGQATMAAASTITTPCFAPKARGASGPLLIGRPRSRVRRKQFSSGSTNCRSEAFTTIADAERSARLLTLSAGGTAPARDGAALWSTLVGGDDPSELPGGLADTTARVV